MLLFCDQSKPASSSAPAPLPVWPFPLPAPPLLLNIRWNVPKSDYLAQNALSSLFASCQSSATGVAVTRLLWSSAVPVCWPPACWAANGQALARLGHDGLGPLAPGMFRRPVGPFAAAVGDGLGSRGCAHGCGGRRSARDGTDQSPFAVVVDQLEILGDFDFNWHPLSHQVCFFKGIRSKLGELPLLCPSLPFTMPKR